MKSTLNVESLPSQHFKPIREFSYSSDKNRIAWTCVGDGLPIVFVHGSLSRGSDWNSVTRHLAPHFKCYQMDRRGSGDSESGQSYSIHREYEDIAVLLSRLGPDVCLVGHSFGAICALGAAMAMRVRRLVLYEPPLPIGGLIAGEDFEPYCSAIDEGRLDDALEIGLRKFVRLPEARIHGMRQAHSWRELTSFLPTFRRELKAMDDLPSCTCHYAGITCPTLLITGSESPAHPYKHAINALAETLPSSRVAILDGQGHMGMRSAHAALAGYISEFVGA